MPYQITQPMLSSPRLTLSHDNMVKVAHTIKEFGVEGIKQEHMELLTLKLKSTYFNTISVDKSNLALCLRNKLKMYTSLRL